MIPVWRDRIVLPDETVILPEQVKMIYYMCDRWNVMYWNLEKRLNRHALTGARFDRGTYLKDYSFITMIYERDKVSTKALRGNIYYDGALWRIYWHNSKINNGNLYEWHEELTVIGHVPYAEDDGQ